LILHRFLDQKPDPWFTEISVLNTAVVWAAILLLPHIGHVRGRGWHLAYILSWVAVAIGPVVNVIAGVLAHDRGEYCGGRIAAIGVALWAVTGLGLVALPWCHPNREQRSATPGQFEAAVRDVVVQPDGKLVLFSDGVVRLLPDGRRDDSFRGSYLFSRRVSLPDPGRWSEGACVATLPDGDIILAAYGSIGRIHADGGDAPDLFTERSSTAACWSLAVQPDGKILAGWLLGPGASRFSRLLPDGKVDATFRPAFVPAPWSSSGKIAVQADGRMVVAGLLDSAPGGCFRTLVRLNADGSLDEGFGFRQPCHTQVEAAGAFAVLVATLPDGSMIVRMEGRRGRDVTYATLHLDSNGAEIRESKLRDTLSRLQCTTAVRTGDGAILAGGRSLARVREDGTPDAAFHVYETHSGVRRILLQGGKILVLEWNGNLVRLDRDGRPDRSFLMPKVKVRPD
jgi:uncharacterized delta-60 repeat protein